MAREAMVDAQHCRGLRGCGEDVVGFLTRVMTRRAEAKSQPFPPLAA